MGPTLIWCIVGGGIAVVLTIPYVLQQTFSADMVQLSPPAQPTETTKLSA